MSQEQAEQQEHGQVTPDEAFDNGFAENGPETVEVGQDAIEEVKTAAQPEEQVLSEQERAPVSPVVPDPVWEEPTPEAFSFVPPQAEGTVQTKAPTLGDVPEEIRAEFGKLREMSPQAAAMALEDTPEGEALRRRLRDLGADSALDRAELVQDRRQRAQAEEQARQQALEAYNRNFRVVLEQDHPELFDPARNTSLLQDIRSWIENKPYTEAAPLMQVYMAGRDPHQVSALVSRFKQERTTAKAPDPTKAFAVPGRGAPIAPPGIGDKDDFEAGFNLK